jgi:nitrite reductase/ring-hydroxylating ferredoxin subunit
MMNFKTGILSISIALFLIYYGCDSSQTGIIPYVPVNRQLNLGNPQYAPLNAVGGYIVLTNEGSRGIIVSRATVDDIAAYDRHCPYNLNDTCGVARPDADGLFAVCKCCGSKWLLLNGTLQSGPASINLKYYNTSFSYPIVTITN